MLDNIEMICKLMKPDLNEYQLAKLRNVLETLLRNTRTKLPNDQLLIKFGESKRLVGIKETTIKKYTLDLNTFLKYMKNDEKLKDKNLADITTADLKDYLSWYNKTHKVSASTVQTMIRTFSSFYDFMVNEDFCEKNPTHKIERVLVEKKLKKAFTEADIEQIRKSCYTKRERAFVEFLYSTGCRISEALALKIQDPNFETGECVVFGKGHKERVVYLSDICMKTLREYLDERTDAEYGDPLFAQLKHPKKFLIPRDAQLLLKELEHRSGVENVHPHRFRRTMATHALERGVPIEQIKEILGHSRLDTTMIYVNISAAKVKDSFKHAFNGRIDANKLEDVEMKDDDE